ncbi:MAG: hypothetical protein WBL35_03930, partial [Ornithinibacter sp.]
MTAITGCGSITVTRINAVFGLRSASASRVLTRWAPPRDRRSGSASFARLVAEPCGAADGHEGGVALLFAD